MRALVIPKFNIGAIDKNAIASRAFTPSGVNSQLPVARPLASELFKSAPADLSAFASLLTAGAQICLEQIWNDRRESGTG